MAINNISDSVRNGMCDAFVDAIDVGSAEAGGDLAIHTAGFVTLLAEPVFSSPAFGTAASGTATANAITDDPGAAATGTAAVLRIRDRDNTTVAEGTVGTVGADLNLNTVSITTNDVVAITSATITVPAG